jgi:outer membrane protein insertion porin family
LDVFDTRTDNTDFSSYVEERAGTGFRFGYHLSEYLTQELGYRFTYDRIADVPDDASIYIIQQEGHRTISMVSHTLTYDRRDSRTEPTQGYVTSLETDFAGVGGSTKYIRDVYNLTHYWSLADDWTFELLGEAGYIYGLGSGDSQDLNINDRFFLGADTFRGFKYGGLGPRDVSTSDSLGGNEYWRGTAELGFPVGLQDEGIKAFVFSDAGALTKLGFSGPNVADDGDPRLSAGFGVSWKSPFGPIRIDIAQPIIKKDYDETELLHVGFGAKF